MNFNSYEVIDYEDKKHKLCSAELAPMGEYVSNGIWVSKEYQKSIDADK